MLLLGVDLAPLAGRLTTSSAHCLLLDIDADALRGLHLNETWHGVRVTQQVLDLLLL